MTYLSPKLRSGNRLSLIARPRWRDVRPRTGLCASRLAPFDTHERSDTTITASGLPTGFGAACLRSCPGGAEVAGALAGAADERHRYRWRGTPVLRLDDVPVSVGGGAAR